MTNPTAPMNLPSLNLNYTNGTFTNTLTGEFSSEVQGVLLAYRESRTLWPSPGELPRLPLCVNGSVYGPCLCAFAVWGADGRAPECSEELTVLLWQERGEQVVTLTARRSMMRVLDQFLNMKALLGGVLHDQRVTLRILPGDGMHRLSLLPGDILDQAAQTRMAQLADRMVEGECDTWVAL